MSKATKIAVRRYQQMLEESVAEAIASPGEMAHAAVLISAELFLTLGELRSHEELRDKGLLRYHDRLCDLVAAPHQKVIFFSHQWASFTEPDPTGAQYAAMVAATTAVSAKNGWKLDSVSIWCNYISIPQKSRGTQALAIKSLSVYSAYAHAFVIVAPPVVHDNTGKVCDLESYNKRMWCRAENLFYSLRNGVKDMWVATGGELERLENKESFMAIFMASNLRVMQGEATDETDKKTLVLPMLGLYAELYACVLVARRQGEAEPAGAGSDKGSGVIPHDRSGRPISGVATDLLKDWAAPVKDEAHLASPAVSDSALSSHNPMYHAAAMVAMINASKSQIFPKAMRFRQGINQGDVDVGPLGAEAQLFGPLVAMVERRVERDGALRRRLHDGAAKRLAWRKG